jgi:AraC family transcriptional regulator
VSVLSGLELLRGAAFEATARRIQRELAAPDTATPLALEALVLELLASAAREATAAPGSALPGWLRDVVALLHERFAEPGLELRRLADVAGVHPVSLSRAFRRHLGRTPGAYLRGLRLEQAARELERSERPLSEVAAAAGFADQSHFTRAFRAAFGATPGEWRRRGVRP